MLINVNSDSVIPQKKTNGSNEDLQEDLNISYDENESNKSMNASKTIEQNFSKTIKAESTRNVITCFNALFKNLLGE